MFEAQSEKEGSRLKVVEILELMATPCCSSTLMIHQGSRTSPNIVLTMSIFFFSGCGSAGGSPEVNESLLTP
jgi:hypothetical protein